MTQFPGHQLSERYWGGWNPDRPDKNRVEFEYAVSVAKTPPCFELPGIASIPVLNQGQQGSCTGHGGAFTLMFDQQAQGQPVVVPSRAMIYYDARIPEGTTGQDSGASIADMVAGLKQYGACTDDEMPYSDQVFNVAPSSQQYQEGTLDMDLADRVAYYPHIDQAIASGRPVVYGMTCYESMMSEQVAATGQIPVPSDSDQSVGGHCTALFGFNMTSEWWTSPSGLSYPPCTKAGRNSWGAWGASGNYFLPQWFFDNGQCSDFHVVQQTGQAVASEERMAA